MLTQGELVVVFHRDGDFDGPVCHRTTSIPTGVVCVPDEDKILNPFASFMAGFAMDEDDALRIEWCEVCHTLARREDALPNKLLFAAPDVMFSFNSHSASLSELTAIVPMANEDRYETIKNREARLRHNTPVVRPTEIRHIQACVHWAVKHGTADIINKAMQAGLTVPLGARPSVGSGLWLQGGIGHLARLHGLACDAIISAVVVSVKSGNALYVGHVPNQHRPVGAVRPENEADLLWAIKGAGTNFGIVVSVTFKAYVALILKADAEAQVKLNELISESLGSYREILLWMHTCIGTPGNCDLV
ncbi:hypothetical protein ZTR_11125 [Talaromyces verruculosus]|nr:hypothetical protein ZTR_11125 [Talaromyces verruculosus]